MQSRRRTATQLGLSTLLVLSWAVQVSAEPITTFNEAYHFRLNIGPNSVGLPPGDRQFVGLLQVSPTAGTAVTATQGAVTRPLPATFSTIFPTTFRSLEPFDPSLTGAWSITATNGPDVAGPLLTLPIANPRLLPLAQNLQIVGTGPTPTVTWSVPDVTGIELNYLRFRVYNDLNNDGILNVFLPRTVTDFAIPAGILFPGVPYIFSVYMQDMDGNVSTAYTQSAYFVHEPLQLLVSSELTDSVKRFDAVTGAYLGDFVSAGIDGQVEPRGLAFGSDGNLYVGGGGDGNPNVKRFGGTTGNFVDTVTSGHPPQINGIAFGSDGHLYGAVFDDDYVFEVDPQTGTRFEDLGAGTPLDGPTGLTFGADGNLYVGSFETGQVLRFDGTTGAYLGVFAALPDGGSTSGLSFGPDGDLYVLVWYCGPAECLSSDILRFDGTTGASKGSFIAPSDPHPVEPHSLLFAPDGTLYVSSHRADEVLRYDGTTGAFLASAAIGGGLDGPFGLALILPEATTDLLVASHANGRVIRYHGATGAPVGNFVIPSSGGLETPFGMAYGPDGNLYVANGISPSTNSVLRYDGLSGVFIDVFCSGLPGPLTQITFGPDHNVYVSAGPAHLVVRCDGTTEEPEPFAGPGSPLDFAAGLTFGPDGNLYVGNWLGNQVLRYDGRTGAYLDAFATVPIAGSDGNVGGVAFGPDGDLYVTLINTGDDIWRFDGTTGASQGSFIPATDPHPDGPVFMLFGPGNILYVSSRNANEVLRYNATTGAFIDHFATGGGLDSAAGIALPEPGVSTQIGAGLAALAALARRRYRRSRRQTLPRA